MENIKFESEKLERFFREEKNEKDAAYIETIFTTPEKGFQLKSFLSKQLEGILSDENGREANLEHILYKIHYDINSKRGSSGSGNRGWYWNLALKIAGIILLPLAVFLGTKEYVGARPGEETWVEIKAPAWTRAQFRLPDGTTGWLNSNSSLKYTGTFYRDRKVTLYGEAFFDVQKDEERPFTVNTEEVILKVTGTRFNVASYENERNVEVVLEEGSMEFNNMNHNRTYFMKPNDLVTYDKTLGDFTTETVQPQKYLSWTEGKLVFRNDPLDVICRRLARWYNIDVKVNVDSVENLRLRATFIDENLEEVLDLLKRSLPIDYKIQNGDLKADNTYNKKRVTILPRNTLLPT
jgi:transmembrane sensor